MPVKPLAVQSPVCSANWKIRRLTRRLAVPAVGEMATSYSYNGPLGILTGKKLARSLILVPSLPKSGRKGSSLGLMEICWNDLTRSYWAFPTSRESVSVLALGGEKTLDARYERIA